MICHLPQTRHVILTVILTIILAFSSIQCTGTQPAAPVPAQSASQTAPVVSGSIWTTDEIMKVPQVGLGDVSPDGKRIAYIVSRAVMTETKSETDVQIFLSDSEGKESRQLTTGDGIAMNPKWSPDGKLLAFISTRGGKPNIWLINPDGGEARRLTDVPTGVAGFNWSPSGKIISFLMPDGPTVEEIKAASGRNDAVVVGTSAKAIRLWLVGVDNSNTPQAPRALTDASRTIAEWDWSPDENTIICTYMPPGKSLSNWISDLARITVSTGVVTELAKTDAAEMNPLYSPDGTQIAYLTTDVPADDFAEVSAMVMPAAGGTPRKLARADLLASPGSLSGWSADGKNLYCIAGHGTLYTIDMIPVDGSATRTFSDNKWHVIGALNRSRNAFGIVMQTAVVPPEIYVTRTDSFRPVKISRVNDYLLNYAVPRTEVVRWKSSDGLEIEGLLTYPLSYTPGKRYPLITYVHGGPAGAFLQQYIGGHDITYPVAALAVRGYAILRPNPRGSTGYGPEFTKANLKDFGGKDFQDIMTGIDRVISLGVADSDRLGIMGWSYGGYMTAWAIGHSTRFKAACVGAGPVDFIGQGACDTPETMFHYFGPPYWEDYQSYVTHSALYYVKDINTPTLILHGTEDDRVPYRQGVALYNALKGRNVAVQLVAYPRSGHSVSEPKLAKDVMERNLEWFGKYLPA